MRKLGYLLVVLVALFTIRQIVKKAPVLDEKQPTPIVEVITEDPEELGAEKTEAEVLEEIDQSNLSEDVKKQLKKDLQYVDINIDISQFDKYHRRVAGQVPKGDDGLLEDLINEMEAGMNDGEDVHWSEAEAELIHELNN